MAVNTSKFLALPPAKKGGELATNLERPGGNLLSIKIKIVKASDILKGTLAAKKVEEKKEKKRAEQLKRKTKEQEIETPENKDTKNAKKLGIKLPQMSWLDGVKNFIFTTLFGWAAIRLLEHLPKLMRLLKPIASIAKWILKVGAFILNALVTFVDAGYKAYDWTKGQITKVFGEDGAQKFDRFSGHLVKFMNLVMTVGMTAAALALAIGDQGPGDIIDDFRQRGRIRGRARNINQLRANRLAGVDLSPNQTNRFNKARKRLMSRGKNTDEAAQIAARFARRQPAKGKIGNLFSPIGDAAKWLKKGTVSNFNKTMQTVATVGNSLRKRWNKITQGAVDNFNKLAKGAQEALSQRILKPFLEFIRPVTTPLLALKDTLMKQLLKIPGLETLLKKIGLNSLSDAPKLAGKFGAKALPWIGGLFNLLFAYDRFANGDLFGGILETVSGALDIAGMWPASLAIDAYLFGRDMFPETVMGAENAIIDVIPGATGIKSQVEGVIKKLPDLGALVKMVSGGAKEESKSSAKAESKSDGVIGDSSDDKAVLPEGSGITPLKVSAVQKRNNGDSVASSASYEDDSLIVDDDIDLSDSPSEDSPSETGKGETLVSSTPQGDEDRSVSADLFYKNAG